jgi:hypothetical protein
MACPINAFYQGERLTKLDLLTIESFLKQEHSFNLFTYNKEIKPQLPGAVILRDANEIMDKDKVFYYKGNGDCVKNSISGFSDIFRYYLLYKVGGWYVDMDVTCLKSFDEIDSDIVLRPHNKTKVVANIIKFPKGNEMLLKLIEDTEKSIDENNNDWIKPLDILKDFVITNNLEKYIVPEYFFGNDNYVGIKNLLVGNYFMHKKSMPKYAIHWCNTAFGTGNWSKEVIYNFNEPLKISAYYVLLKQHNLI